MTLEEIAAAIGAQLVGDGSLVVTGIAGIDKADNGQLTFIANPRYQKQLLSTRASAVIVPPDIKEGPVPLLISPDPYAAFIKVIEIFFPEKVPEPGISQEAWIDPSVQLGEGVTVFPFVYIGRDSHVGARTILYPFTFLGEGVKVGEDCRIHSHVSVREGCTIGDRVILHNGVVVGADGFGYLQIEQHHKKIPQVGIVSIESDVEIGSNTCIDRATMGETRVGAGTKIDNLVQLGHNVHIGDNVILVSQVGISGSTTVGDRAILGGQVGVVGHVKIGKDVKIGAKSGVHTPIKDGMIVAGIPAMPYKTFVKTIAVFKQLPKLREKIRAMEKALSALKRQNMKENKKEGGGL